MKERIWCVLAKVIVSGILAVMLGFLFFVFFGPIITRQGIIAGVVSSPSLDACILIAGGVFFYGTKKFWETDRKD